MKRSIARGERIERFLDRVSGQHSGKGNPRVKQVVRRIVGDLYRTIEDLDVRPDEFWKAIGYLTSAGQTREFGLISPGLGFDHFLDLRMDAMDEETGIAGGTPRTIEGPLYVEGAPLVKSEARLDDGREAGEVLFMTGRVLNIDGRPLAGAIVDVWHADTHGNYSFFDSTQTEFNLRRRIETDSDGYYRFRSIMPSAYGVEPGGATDVLLELLGRHGRRPAHIHFFISAPGHRHLTTQINIADDPLLHDDFAFATRDGLIPEVVRKKDPGELMKRGLKAPFAEIHFDFVLQPTTSAELETVVEREHPDGDGEERPSKRRDHWTDTHAGG